MPKKITQCPVARSVARVGDEWSVLILRDALYGLTRFDEFQKSLGIAPNILTRRLASLTEAGMLERNQYSEHPPRYEYRLTEIGRDFRTVVLAMVAWGNRHFAHEGLSMMIVDAKTGEAADPILVDRISGRPLISPEFRIVAGPAANETLKKRYQSLPPTTSLMESPQ
jgi:DNA-binding HxlR family transcriptional regulator